MHRTIGKVQLLSGVAVGERVVTKGAYQIKLSTASGTLPHMDMNIDQLMEHKTPLFRYAIFLNTSFTVVNSAF